VRCDERSLYANSLLMASTAPPISASVLKMCVERRVPLNHASRRLNRPGRRRSANDVERNQSLVPFEFTIERYRLPGSSTYVVRTAIVSEILAVWTADNVKIDVTPSTVEPL